MLEVRFGQGTIKCHIKANIHLEFQLQFLLSKLGIFMSVRFECNIILTQSSEKFPWLSVFVNKSS